MRGSERRRVKEALGVRTEHPWLLPRLGLGGGVIVRIMCSLYATTTQRVMKGHQSGHKSGSGKGTLDPLLREDARRQLPR